MRERDCYLINFHQCFESFGWWTGRASDLPKTLHQQLSKMLDWETFVRLGLALRLELSLWKYDNSVLFTRLDRLLPSALSGFDVIFGCPVFSRDVDSPLTVAHIPTSCSAYKNITEKNYHHSQLAHILTNISKQHVFNYTSLSPFKRPFSNRTWVSRCLLEQRMMEVVVTTGLLEL